MTQKTEETEDLRVQRTRKMLQEALIELTVEKGFSAVTVRDITERAMVNRSTFYRHYLDKFDLLEQYMEVFNTLTTEDDLLVLESRRGQVVEDVPQGLLNLLKHVQAFADFYRIMLGQQGDPYFTANFRQNTAKRFRALLSGVEAVPGEPPLEMKLNYISCAGVGAILWWLDNGQPCSAEQLARWLSHLSLNGMGLTKVPSQEVG